MNKFYSPLLFLAAISLIAAFLVLHFSPAQPVVMFGIIFIAASVCYAAMAWFLVRVEVSTKALLAIVVASIALRLSFVGMNPVGSEDAYRYVWDGKVQAHGINPYLYSAIDERLAFLRSSLLPA
ncbi:MAG TPA: hypothetical protein VMM58_05370, partial [Bacteroidota bacterium]|nr:hypothetical protein [Bacteroidota bacterium]